MARGGYRPGAGRPPGSKNKKPDEKKKKSKKTKAKKSPVDYLLDVINDDDQDKEMRLRAAIAAAPFVHAKQSGKGKKEEKQEKANKASKRFKASKPPKLKAIK